MRFRHHIFICTNQRDDGDSCGARGSLDLLKCLKQSLRDRGLDAPGGVMANKSGCFGLCSQGPNLVVYPEGRWLRLETAGEVEELVDGLGLPT